VEVRREVRIYNEFGAEAKLQATKIWNQPTNLHTITHILPCYWALGTLENIRFVLQQVEKGSDQHPISFSKLICF
jgi:hypothetical protein